MCADQGAKPRCPSRTLRVGSDVKGWLGIALVVACVWVMRLVRTRGAKPVGLVKSDTFQTFYVLARKAGLQLPDSSTQALLR
jgi:hypothetical protein